MKTRTHYICQECGHRSLKWLGKCPSCGTWGSLLEEIDQSPYTKPTVQSSAIVTTLATIPPGSITRIVTGIGEFDRVMGGGIVPGSVIIVGGDPGVGKSTLMLQLCATLVDHNPMYVTGEESIYQLRHRAERMRVQDKPITVIAEQSLASVLAVIDRLKPGIVVIDSIQTLFSDEVDSLPGSLNQLRFCTTQLVNIAKRTGIPIFLIGHVTKEGMLAGPRVLEHMVDAVIQFEGEGGYAYRILRATKNRFGSTNEIGVFEMTNVGLIEVSNPSALFLSNRQSSEAGTSVAAVIEGSRSILVEVQALVLQSGYSVPQRVSTGYDNKRLQMLLAVLERRAGYEFVHRDVFLNVAGGLIIRDPGADLAVCMALLSSLQNRPIAERTVLIGEVGLTGELRLVSNIEARLKETEKLGFLCAIIPPVSNLSHIALEIKPAANLGRVLSLIGL